MTIKIANIILVGILAMALWVACGRGEYTQDDYEETANKMANRFVEIEAALELCSISGEEFDDLLAADADYQEAFHAFDMLEEQMNDLIEEEGIDLPPDFDVRRDRVSPEDWEKMASLSREFIEAGVALFEAMATVIEKTGCDV